MTESEAAGGGDLKVRLGVRGYGWCAVGLSEAEAVDAWVGLWPMKRSGSAELDHTIWTSVLLGERGRGQEISL